jgi:hypothetical protein
MGNNSKMYTRPFVISLKLKSNEYWWSFRSSRHAIGNDVSYGYGSHGVPKS